MEFSQKWCPGDIPIPLVHRRMDFWDQYKVMGDSMEDAEDKPFFLLNLKATMKAQWLERALKLPFRGWRNHGAEVGLVK